MPKYTDIYRQLKLHIQKTGMDADKDFSEQEFEKYMERLGNAKFRTNRVTKRDNEIHNIVFNQLVLNQKAAKDLASKIPVAEKYKNEYMKQLERDAATFARADAKKKEASLIEARRKEARQRLEAIRRERIKNAAKEQDRVATEQELAKPKTYDESPTSWARGRHLFTAAVNHFGHGPQEDRLGLLTNGEKDPSLQYENKKGAIPIEHISDDEKIKLTGGMYEPNNPGPEKKVVIVFSGSHGPGSKYIDSIKNAYLEKGITVVQLDYRGFGNSTNLDENGQPTENSLSERTLYEDGMEMYKYVNEKMGIKPENITLHGYSLGGPVASRVALEVTKRLENQRIMENEPKDPTKGLGGVVLQSPLNNMYYIGNYAKGPIAGVGAWVNGGAYNSTNHMLELAKIDPNIPVHLIGGIADKNNRNYDYLAPETTGLETELQGKFTNYSTYHGEGDHLQEYHFWRKDHNDNYILNDAGKRIDVCKKRPNVVADDPGLSRVVGQGRSVNNELKRELDEMRVGGPNVN